MPHPPASPVSAARNPARLFLLLAAAVWALIVFGALVRAKQAGLACPDWPLCHGAVVPDLKLDGVVYEWGHRALAGIVSLAYVGGALAVLGNPLLRKMFARQLWAGGALLLAQVVLGGLTVLIVHKGHGSPRPEAWTVTSHLMLGNAFGAFALLTGLQLRALAIEPGPGASAPVTTSVRRLVSVWTLLLLVQFVLGGTIAANLGGVICTEFPTCNGGIWFPTWDGLIGLQLLHRLNAYVLLVLGICLGLVARRHPRLARGTTLLAVLVVLQGVIGAANVLSFLHVGVTTAHSAVAALLFSTTAWVWWRMARGVDRGPI